MTRRIASLMKSESESASGNDSASGSGNWSGNESASGSERSTRHSQENQMFRGMTEPDLKVASRPSAFEAAALPTTRGDPS
jgi:hypothetical protein